MNIIYLDTLFFTNLLIDYLLLLCTGRLCGCSLNRKALILASLIGAAYACASVMHTYTWLNHILIKIALAIIICMVAFRKNHHFTLICLAFIAISSLFGGFLSACSLSFQNTFYLPVNFKILLLTFTAGYFIIEAIYKKSDTIKRQELHDVTVKLNNRIITFTALKDTGNELFDPMSGRRVLVCEKKIVSSLFPNENLDLHRDDVFSLFYTINKNDQYAGKMSLIPFRTINGSGTMLSFRPDAITVDNHHENLIVAISDTKFDRNDSYQAIF